MVASLSYRSILLTILVIVVVDQGTKNWVLHYLPNLVVYNYQGTWGILPSWAPILGFISLFALVWYQRQLSLPLLVLFAAGMSNMVDRWLYGGVIDFIKIANFPIFNGADVMISIAIIWVAASEFIGKKIKYD